MEVSALGAVEVETALPIVPLVGERIAYALGLANDRIILLEIGVVAAGAAVDPEQQVRGWGPGDELMTLNVVPRAAVSTPARPQVVFARA